MPDAVIIGAGPAGLACAVTMRKAGIASLVLDKAAVVGSVWRRHYDRLHLHTDRSHSSLPGLPMPRTYPRYPSRGQVTTYLEHYAQHFGIAPVLNTGATRVFRGGNHWHVETTSQNSFSAPIVVIATGWADFPYRPSFPGVEAFGGSIIHSSAYQNPASYVGKRVLVVGFGNSGGEIALDLAEAGIDVSLSVRGPLQILPRDLLGIPILTLAIAEQALPARIADFLNAPALRLAIGDIEKYGLRRATKGPRRMIEEDGRVPLLDVGTMNRIRDGSIKVRGDIDHFTRDGIAFSRSSAARFDAVILATGFRPDFRLLLPDAKGVYDEEGKPLVSGRVTAESGLFFCGLIASPTGQIREIGIEAKRIAAFAKDSLAGQ
jgi:cation diffusion facilitator CzcD-associated flavoprotein CzcO